MSSLSRTISSRANGALSKGPTTPAGKSRSSRNATRHGLMAKCVVLDDESREAFDTLLAGFVERFAPNDAVELGLVEEMFSAFWRQRRAWAIETRIMDNAIATQPLDEDELTRLAGGFASIAAQPPLELMHRYETRLHRIFQRALANLIKLRSQPELTPPSENIELPNDPSPISEQFATPETEVGPPPPNEDRSPIRAPNVREGSCEATQPAPLAENIELPNDPSPISGQSATPETEPLGPTEGSASPCSSFMGTACSNRRDGVSYSHPSWIGVHYIHRPPSTLGPPAAQCILGSARTLRRRIPATYVPRSVK